MKRIIVGIAAACVFGAWAATTFEELRSEIANAADGATVYVENDIEYSDLLVNGLDKRITLASPEGQTNVLRRAASYTFGKFMVFTGSGDHVTFRDVVVDGNKAAGPQDNRFIEINGGTLTLDAGCELRNVHQSCEASIQVTGNGEMVMNDGAVIRGFENSAYGTVIMCGRGSDDGIFRMNGGLITDCASTRNEESRPDAYGGVVYLWGGRIYMYGGAITGNRAARCCAGISGFQGEIHFKGTATVTNNVSEIVNDVSCWGHACSAYIHLDGPWSGYATVYAPRVADGESDWAGYIIPHEGFVPNTGDNMPGLGKLSVQDHPEYVASGYATGYSENTGYASFFFVKALARFGNRLVAATIDETVDSMQDGDCVEFLRDVTLWGRKELIRGPMTVTIRSATEEPVTISRHRDVEWIGLLMVSNNVSVVLENIVLDGNAGEESTEQGSLVVIGECGHVTLGRGAVLQNSFAKTQAPAVYVVDDESTLTMEDGSIVRNCRTTDGWSWATAIRVGMNSEGSKRQRFTMNGGVISNCVSAASNPAASGFGGAVYVQNADFFMNGGVITGNTAFDGGSAGIQTWNGGCLYFSGTAVVADNPGVSPDVFVNEKANAYMRGDFRGRVGISSGGQANDSWLCVTAEEGSTGAWNFFTAKTDPYGKYAGYTWIDSMRIYALPPDGTIDGVGVVGVHDNVQFFAPKAIDADKETLPHVFGGSARAAGGHVVVTFDEAAARESGRTVIPLLAAVEGSSLTGTWTFDVPVAEKGIWKVGRVRSGTDVIAYQARWCAPGMEFFIR